MSLFDVKEHVIPCQHIREYPHALKREGTLYLSVKEYTPKVQNQTPPGDLTIIATHGNGIAKECYEPLWDELLKRLPSSINAIWMADCSNQGYSGVLNESIQGDDPNWFDHARDLLHMVNHFRDRMTQPIIGIGHSLGVSQLVHLSLMHPRLFHAVVFLEPVMQVENPPGSDGPMAAKMVSIRRDLWKSREQAESSIRRSPFYAKWDPRALEKYLQHGLRELPTAVYPESNSSEGSITLTTSKAQEAWTMQRLNSSAQEDDPADSHEHLVSPDLAEISKDDHLNGRNLLVSGGASAMAYYFLPHLRPSVLYVFGDASWINIPERRADKLERTGVGLGGSGGAKKGRVKARVLPKGTHTVPLEQIEQTSAAMGEWISEQLAGFADEQRFWAHHDSEKSERDRTVLSAKWMEVMNLPAGSKRPLKWKL